MVKLYFEKENSFMTELISSAPNAELIEDRTHNEGLIGIIEAYLKGNNPTINVGLFPLRYASIIPMRPSLCVR
ncbi:MAG: hypothetical protein DRG35_04530, partial [Deltaproteobacteria bacterium]